MLIKKISFLIFLFLSLWGFYHINLLNYKKTQEIKYSVIQHPEYLPTATMARYTSFGFKNIKADMYWLDSIQYIWWNPFKSEYKKYLSHMLNLITDLNPLFENPYVIWELLLPAYNHRYEKDVFSKEELTTFTQQAIALGLKWVKNFCDPKKLELIKTENNLNILQTDNKYKNACTSAKIPFNLAFIYFHYLHNPKQASYYYKVASTDKDTFKWAKIMAAIMQWKGGNREKSFFMFANMAIQSEETTSHCSHFAKNIYQNSLQYGLSTDAQYIQLLEKNYHIIFAEEIKDSIENPRIIQDASCLNYLQKSLREQNLFYIQHANTRYLKDKKTNALTAKILFDEGYITFLPTDPQNHGEEFDLIYMYNDELKQFDYQRNKY